MLITKDVPINYDATNPLEPTTWVTTQQALVPQSETAPIRLPILTGKNVLWNWLQPYLVTNTDGSRGTEYNGLPVGVDGMFDFVIFSFYLFRGFHDCVLERS
jgi:hypothetical protein